MRQNALTDLIGRADRALPIAACQVIIIIVVQSVHTGQNRNAAPKLAQRAFAQMCRYSFAEKRLKVIALHHRVRIGQSQLFQNLDIGLFCQRLMLFSNHSIFYGAIFGDGFSGNSSLAPRPGGLHFAQLDTSLRRGAR